MLDAAGHCHSALTGLGLQVQTTAFTLGASAPSAAGCPVQCAHIVSPTTLLHVGLVVQSRTLGAEQQDACQVVRVQLVCLVHGQGLAQLTSLLHQLGQRAVEATVGQQAPAPAKTNRNRARATEKGAISTGICQVPSGTYWLIMRDHCLYKGWYKAVIAMHQVNLINCHVWRMQTRTRR